MTVPVSASAPAGVTSAKVKPSGWWVALAIFLLVAGPGGCTAVFVSKSVNFLNDYNRFGSFTMPVEDGTVHLDAKEGQVGIFLRSASKSAADAIETIQVTDPSGHRVELLTPEGDFNEQIPSGGYLSILRWFHVRESGDYHLHATSSASARGAELAVGRYDLKSLTSWLLGSAAIGGVMFLVGLVLLILVMVRRSRSRRQFRAATGPAPPYWGAPGAPPPPPGWGGVPPGQPPYPQYPPQPQQPTPPPGWVPPPPQPPPGPPAQPPSPTPAPSPAPPEQWAPGPWRAPDDLPPPPPSPPPA
jgi:hypothetical protein